MKSKKSLVQGGFTLVELLVVMSIIAALAAMAYPVIMGRVRAARIPEATNNAKQTLMVLRDFETDYGKYPDDSTADQLTADGYANDRILKGTTSNDYFRQLFAAGKTKSEIIFFADVANDEGFKTKKPDENFSKGKCLETGECGFAYIFRKTSGGTRIGLTSDDMNAPVLITPLATNNGFTFNKSSFGDKMMVIRNNAAVETINIRDDKTVPKLFKKDEDGNDTDARYTVIAPAL